ncbi:MAG: transglutaminase-like domain-containing protein [Clostridiales bacterium]|nr:transglutaminase-like domain-containing protein [Clostridiales bacterium]
MSMYKRMYPSVLPAMLFTCGAASLLLKYYAVRLSFALIAFVACILVLAIHFVLLNRWTLAVLCSLPFAALPGIWLMNRRDPGYAIRLGEKAIAYLAEAADFLMWNSSSEYIHAKRFVICIAFCMVFALPAVILFKRLRGALIMGAIGFGLFYFCWFFGERDYYTELCIIAPALIPIGAGAYARKRPGMGSDPQQGGFRIVAVTLPLILAATLLITLVLPQDTYTMRSYRYEAFVDDIANLTGLYTGRQGKGVSFDLEEFGFHTGDLGGAVDPHHEPVFTLTASPPTLLRAAVRDVYTGYAWEQSANSKAFSYNSFLTANQRGRAFAEGLPAPTSGSSSDENSGFSSRRVMTVTIVGTGLDAVLLHSGRPYRFDPLGVADFIPFFDMMGVMSARHILPAGGSYRVEEERLRFTEQGFSQAVRAIEDKVRMEKEAGFEPDPYYQDILARHTSLPDTVGPSVIQYAQSVAAGASSPYQKAAALRSAIARNATYTLQAPEAAPGIEFVRWFLETRQGHCQHYASAMVVLTRTLGIPSRYVEGFTTFGLSPDKDGIITVTGGEAHTWCEIYLEGIGWIPVDATLTYESQDGGSSLPVFDLLDGVEYSQSEEEDWWAFWGLEEGEAEDLPARENPVYGIPSVDGRLILILVIGCPALALWMAVKRMQRSFRLSWLIRKYSPKAILMMYWRDVLWMLPFFGIQPQTGETLTHLVQRTGAIRYVDGDRISFGSDFGSIAVIAGLVERCLYGEIMPSGEDLSNARSAQLAFDSLLRRKLKPADYLRKRILRDVSRH